MFTFIGICLMVIGILMLPHAIHTLAEVIGDVA